MYRYDYYHIKGEKSDLCYIFLNALFRSHMKMSRITSVVPAELHVREISANENLICGYSRGKIKELFNVRHF